MIRNMHIRLKEHTSGWCRTLLLAALLFGLSASAAKANTYYVSPNGNNTDGLTYQTAFNELDQVQWQSLNSAGGLNLIIDGGTSGLTYHTPLTVPAGVNVTTISASLDPGHTGTVSIDGAGNASTSGINIIGAVQTLNGNMSVNGTMGSLPNLIVQHWSGSGVRISGSVQFLHALRVKDNAVGVNVAGSSGRCFDLGFALFHDNTTNILNNGELNGLEYCWIFQDYDVSPKSCTGLSSSVGNTSVADCVFGPGLVYGVKGSQGASFDLGNCLFLNATDSNVFLSGSETVLTMGNCTSYMTNLNPTGSAHSCIKAPNLTGPIANSIYNSIFEGGAVIIPVGAIQASNNTEYAVTGNTTALASTQTNPEFISNVAAYPNNVSFKVLKESNFALQSGSPATGQGVSLITSVSAFLKEF
jgi:hypothetical protein